MGEARVTRRLLALALSALVLGATAGCSKRSNRSGEEGERHYGQVLKIAAGSENEAVFFQGKDAEGHNIKSDLIRKFESDNRVDLDVKLMGSVDIMHQAELGTGSEFDALFAASSVWLQLGNEKSHAVKDARSIYQSPVVCAVLQQTAKKLGWLESGRPKPLTVDAILDAAERGDLHFAMTTPTRSNSGNAAYMSLLYAFAGHAAVLTAD